MNKKGQKTDDYLHVGEIIKARRKQLNVTLKELAEGLGTSTQNISSLEKRQSIDFRMAMKINRILQFDIFTHFQEPEYKDQMINILEKKLLDLQEKYIKLLEEKN